MKVAVIGQGYVGLPLAIAFSNAGVQVVGIDVDKKLIENLNSGISHVEDVKHEDLQRVLKDGNYKASLDHKVVHSMDAAIVTVPTPLGEDGEPDLEILRKSISDFAQYLAPSTLVSIESSSYPGTLRNIVLPILKEANPSWENFKLVSAPERVDPLNKSWNQKNTPRVLGPLDSPSGQLAKELYSRICEELVMVSSPEVAESAKMLENAFRLVNISFINEVSMNFRSMGIDALEVINAAATKPYGFMRFNPGPGVGGHCIPVDPVYLHKFFKENNLSSCVLDIAIRQNSNHKETILKEIQRLLPKSKRHLLVGLSYKPGISDTRESPAVWILENLRESGYEVEWYDSRIDEHNGETRSNLDSSYSHGVVLVEQPYEDLLRVSACCDQTIDFSGSLHSNDYAVSFFRGKF